MSTMGMSSVGRPSIGASSSTTPLSSSIWLSSETLGAILLRCTAAAASPLGESLPESPSLSCLCSSLQVLRCVTRPELFKRLRFLTALKMGTPSKQSRFLICRVQLMLILSSQLRSRRRGEHFSTPSQGTISRPVMPWGATSASSVAGRIVSVTLKSCTVLSLSDSACPSSSSAHLKPAESPAVSWSTGTALPD
eukprot:Blabericola_migrator_1__9309@NODE_4_length_29828_cov_96_571587_g3_i0_p12_GENE_NODE_4_length_29828_cov_96_571587_g3_i0NODE_4_length_29828_cov_96_571587_g3_i0_p12_ORF_typecomplete_len194_score16_24_NODE_4_length_29828_cov_96_571587_g3_i01670817289